MTCTFYQTLSDRNKIEKTLGELDTKNIVFLESVDVLKPRLTVRGLPDNANYCFISPLNRFYFIDHVTILKNNLYDVELSEDVLYTYKNDVKNSIADILESENIINTDKNDYNAENKDTVSEIAFDNPFTSSSDILITVQGV